MVNSGASAFRAGSSRRAPLLSGLQQQQQEHQVHSPVAGRAASLALHSPPNSVRFLFFFTENATREKNTRCMTGLLPATSAIREPHATSDLSAKFSNFIFFSIFLFLVFVVIAVNWDFCLSLFLIRFGVFWGKYFSM